jgi:pimeloyl-ACP methyl ester carboxylesterase
MIRGASVDNPVLLYLTGGPGGTDLGAMRADTTLEQDFVVVTWDQRGAGKSYAALEPIDTLTLDRTVADAVEVTNYLRDRFDEEKIYVVGNSWGTTLGVLAVQQHPQLYYAFVGTGQMVSQRATDVMFWEDTLAWAERTGNAGLADTLRRNGPPPYDDVTRYEYATSHEHDWNPYPEFDPGTEMPAILFVPEYNWMDRVNAFRGFFDSAAVIYPKLQGIDFRVDVPRLDVPFYMVIGEHEARGRAMLANEWFDMLEAPHKERIVFTGAGHRPQFDQPAQFADVMRRVLAATLTDTTRGG